MVCDPRQPEGTALDPQLLPVFSRVAGWTGAAAALRVRRILGDALSGARRLVDVGTGPATIPLHLKRHYPGCSILGCDISWPMLQRVRRRSNDGAMEVFLAAADGTCLPLGADSVDVVTCFFTLHHLDHPEDFFREADRVLRPGGALLVIDFRRDMPPHLFRWTNGLWRLAFLRSRGREGFAESVRSAWRPGEIRRRLAGAGLSRFRVHAGRMELWVTHDH